MCGQVSHCSGVSYSWMQSLVGGVEWSSLLADLTRVNREFKGEPSNGLLVFDPL